MRVEAEIAAGPRRELHLLDGPRLAALRVAPHLGRGEGVERIVEHGIDGDQLALEMGRELGDLNAVLGRLPFQLVAIGLARGRLVEVDEALVPGGDLHPLVAERGGPAADRAEAVMGRLVADELGQEDRGALDGLHVAFPLVMSGSFARSRRRG